MPQHKKYCFSEQVNTYEHSGTLLKHDHKNFFSSVMVPGAMEANKASGKKQNLRISNIKSMKAPGKTFWETRKSKETFIQTSQAKLRLATINVRTLVGGYIEVMETVGKKESRCSDFARSALQQ